jgi:hypothetical protein
LAEEPKQQDLATINLGNINEGVALEAFQKAMEEVLANILDLSTVATATRAVVLKVEFKPESDRCKIHTEFAVTTKLAGMEKHVGKFFIARTTEGGLVGVDRDPRQLPLWEAPRPAQTPLIEFRRNGADGQ